MATAGSRTSSSGLLDSNGGGGAEVGDATRGSSSAPGLPSGPGRAKRGAAESSQWRRKELRKVRSVELDGADALLLLEHGIGAAPAAQQLHFSSVSSPGAVQAVLLQQSPRVQQSNSLTEHPLTDKASNSLATAAQEILKSSLIDHGAPGTSMEVNASQHR